MGLTSITDTIGRTLGGVTSTVADTFGDTTIRLGVTGLSRAGKTVFITSLVANMLERGRMTQLQAVAGGSVKSVYLQPQPDDTIPRFDYETHLAAILGQTPHWPQSTSAVSELRLSMRVQPQGMLSGITGPRTVHLDIIDYPGEWLLDLVLLDQDYDTWALDTLARIKDRPMAQSYLAQVAQTDVDQKFSDPVARALADSYGAYLNEARESGFSDCTPGRFLLPGELAGSPALTFAPLPQGAQTRGGLRREMSRRYEAYKSRVVRPFFRNHFSKLDRQIVLVDVLGALANGPGAMRDLRRTLSELLSAFRPGRNAFLSQLLLGKRVDRILFAATKADHLHHSQHAALTGLMAALTADARDRAQFAGAQTQAMSVSALRCTVEDEVTQNGVATPVVLGRLKDTGRQVAFHPGDLPNDPTRVLNTQGDTWPFGDITAADFAPAVQSLRAGDGPPHIRLDRAMEFLIGDRLR